MDLEQRWTANSSRCGGSNGKTRAGLTADGIRYSDENGKLRAQMGSVELVNKPCLIFTTCFSGGERDLAGDASEAICDRQWSGYLARH